MGYFTPPDIARVDKESLPQHSPPPRAGGSGFRPSRVAVRAASGRRPALAVDSPAPWSGRPASRQGRPSPAPTPLPGRPGCQPVVSPRPSLSQAYRTTPTTLTPAPAGGASNTPRRGQARVSGLAG